MPEGRLAVVMDNAGQPTAMEQETVLVFDKVSVDLRLKVEDCTVVGVPLTSPLDAVIDKPDGRLPPVIE